MLRPMRALRTMRALLRCRGLPRARRWALPRWRAAEGLPRCRRPSTRGRSPADGRAPDGRGRSPCDGRGPSPDGRRASDERRRRPPSRRRPSDGPSRRSARPGAGLEPVPPAGAGAGLPGWCAAPRGPASADGRASRPDALRRPTADAYGQTPGYGSSPQGAPMGGPTLPPPRLPGASSSRIDPAQIPRPPHDAHASVVKHDTRGERGGATHPPSREHDVLRSRPGELQPAVHAEHAEHDPALRGPAEPERHASDASRAAARVAAPGGGAHPGCRERRRRRPGAVRAVQGVHEPVQPVARPRPVLVRVLRAHHGGAARVHVPARPRRAPRGLAERPELHKGSVEYAAPGEYMVRPPMAPALFFLVDVNPVAVQTGATTSACEAILRTLDAIPEQSGRSSGSARSTARVTFLSFREAAGKENDRDVGRRRRSTSSFPTSMSRTRLYRAAWRSL